MKIFVLILFTLLMFSCSGILVNKKKETDFLKSIAGKWTLSEMKGISNTDIQNLRKRPYLKFKGNKINGTSGCNNFFSSIPAITKNKISFSPFGETKMMCQEMIIPDKFGMLISNINSYTIKEKTLFFLNNKSEKVLTFIKE